MALGAARVQGGQNISSERLVSMPLDAALEADFLLKHVQDGSAAAGLAVWRDGGSKPKVRSGSRPREQEIEDEGSVRDPTWLQARSIEESKREYMTAGMLDSTAPAPGRSAARGTSEDDIASHPTPVSTATSIDGDLERLGRELAALAYSGHQSFSRLLSQRGSLMQRLHDAYEAELSAMRGSVTAVQPPQRARFTPAVQLGLSAAVVTLVGLLEATRKTDETLYGSILAQIDALVQSCVPLAIGDGVIASPASGTGVARVGKRAHKGDGLRAPYSDGGGDAQSASSVTQLPAAATALAHDMFDKLVDALARSVEDSRASQSLRQTALELLVRLAVARGSLSDCIRAVELLLTVLPGSTLRVGNSMAALASADDSMSLPLPLTRDRVGSWRIANETGFTNASACCDGKFVYVQSNHGIFKVGTGESGTSPGRVYASTGAFAQPGFLVFAAGKLLYRPTTSCNGDVLATVISCEHLTRVGDIRFDGSGSFPSADNSAVIDTAEEAPDLSEFMFPNEVPLAVLTNTLQLSDASTRRDKTTEPPCLTFSQHVYAHAASMCCTDCGEGLAYGYEDSCCGNCGAMFPPLLCQACLSTLNSPSCENCGATSAAPLEPYFYMVQCGYDAAHWDRFGRPQMEEWLRTSGSSYLNMQASDSAIDNIAATVVAGDHDGAPGATVPVLCQRLLSDGQFLMMLSPRLAPLAVKADAEAFSGAAMRGGEERDGRTVPDVTFELDAFNPRAAFAHRVHLVLQRPSGAASSRAGYKNALCFSNDSSVLGSDGAVEPQGGAAHPPGLSKKERRRRNKAASKPKGAVGHMLPGCYVGAPSHLQWEGEGTVEAWLRPSQADLLGRGEGGCFNIVKSVSPKTSQGFTLFFYGGNLHVAISGPSGIVVSMTCPSGIAADTWSHCAVTCAKSSEGAWSWSILVNGSVVISQVASTGFVKHHGIWILGGEVPRSVLAAWGFGSPAVVPSLAGALAHVRIWSIARHVEVVQRDMRVAISRQNCNVAHPDETGAGHLEVGAPASVGCLLGSWPLDDGRGVLARDDSAYSCPALIIGGGWTSDARTGDPSALEPPSGLMAVTDPASGSSADEPGLESLTVPCTAALQSVAFTNGESVGLYYPVAALTAMFPALDGVRAVSSLGLYQTFSLADGVLQSEDLVVGTSAAVGTSVAAGGSNALWTVGFDSEGHAVACKVRYRQPLQLPPWYDRTSDAHSLRSLVDPLTIEQLQVRGDSADGSEGADESDGHNLEALPARTVALSILRFIDRKCDRASEAHAIARARGKAGSPAPADLGIQMAVQLTPANFRALHSLIVHLAPRYLDETAIGGAGASAAVDEITDDDRFIAVDLYGLHTALRAFITNLEHLVGWNVPPSSVGFSSAVSRDHCDHRLKTADLVSMLTSLFEHSASRCGRVHAIAEPGMRESISVALSTGMSVFCATPEDRLAVLVSLVQKHLRARATAPPLEGRRVGIDAEPDERVRLRELLIRRYFTQMSTPANVVSLLSVVDGTSSLDSSASPAWSDRPASIDHLIKGGVTLVLQYTETALLDLIHDPAGVTEASGGAGQGDTVRHHDDTRVEVPEHLAALIEFLVRTQTVILSRAQVNPDPKSNAFFSYMPAYAHRLIDACAELLEFCVSAGAWPAAPLSSAAVLRRKHIVVETLRQSVGSLLISLFSSLWALPIGVYHSLALLPRLKRLLHAIDVLASGLPDVVAAEAASGEHVRWLVVPQQSTCESDHPVTGRIVTASIRVPGAKQMKLKFDNKMQTWLQQGATLSLYEDAARQKLLPGGNISSCADLTVKTDAVYVHWSSGYLQGAWGFRITAHADVEQEVVSIPWLLDLQKSVGAMAGRCAGVLVRGSPSYIDMQIGDPVSVGLSVASRTTGTGGARGHHENEPSTKDGHRDVEWFLECELARAGMQSVSGASDVDAAFNDALGNFSTRMGIDSADIAASSGADITGRPHTPEALYALVELLVPCMSDVPTDSFRVSSHANAGVTSVIRWTVAVLLLHNHLVEVARSTVEAASTASGNPDVPPDLIVVWQTAHRIKRWLRPRFQSVLLAETRRLEAQERQQRESKVRGRSELESKEPVVEAESKDAGTRSSSSGEVVVDRARLYSGVCSAVVERCRLLCTLRPVPLAAPSSRPPSLLLQRSRSTSSADESRPGVDSDTAEKRRAAQATVAAWQSTQDAAMHTQLDTANAEQRHQIVWRMVLQVYERTFSVSSVLAAMWARQRRARLRSSSLRAFRVLLDATSLPSVMREIVVQIPPALSVSEGEASQGVAPKLMSGLSGCGAALAESVRGGFADLYERMVALLIEHDSPPLQLAVLYGLALSYSPQEYAVVHRVGVFPALARMLTPKADQSVQTATWALLDLLVTTWLGGVQSTNGASIAETVGGAGAGSVAGGEGLNPVLNILFSQLASIATRLRELGSTTTASSTVDREVAARAPTLLAPAGPLKAGRAREAALSRKVESAATFGIQHAEVDAGASSTGAAVDSIAGGGMQFGDSFVVKVLNLCHKLAHLASTRHAMAEPTVLTSLFTVVFRGSPRARLVATLVLRWCLLTSSGRESVARCRSADQAVLEAQSEDEEHPKAPHDGSHAVPGQATVMALFRMIGAAKLAPAFATLLQNKVATSVRADDVRSILNRVSRTAATSLDGVSPSAAFVTLLRWLAQESTAWNAALAHSVSECLADTHLLWGNLRESDTFDPSMVRSAEETWEPALAELSVASDTRLWSRSWALAGALSAVGGHISTLGVGARVRSVHGDFAGVVVSRGIASDEVVVLRDDHRTTATASINDLELVVDMPLNLSQLMRVTDGLTCASLVDALLQVIDLHSEAEAAASATARRGEPCVSNLAVVTVSTLHAVAVRALQSVLHVPEAVEFVAAGGHLDAVFNAAKQTTAELDVESTSQLEDFIRLTGEALMRRLPVSHDVVVRMKISKKDAVSFFVNGTPSTVSGLVAPTIGPHNLPPLSERKKAGGKRGLTFSDADGSSKSAHRARKLVSVRRRKEGAASRAGSEETKGGEGSAGAMGVPPQEVAGTLTYVSLEEDPAPFNSTGRIVLLDSQTDFYSRARAAERNGAAAVLLSVHDQHVWVDLDLAEGKELQDHGRKASSPAAPEPSPSASEASARAVQSPQVLEATLRAAVEAARIAASREMEQSSEATAGTLHIRFRLLQQRQEVLMQARMYLAEAAMKVACAREAAEDVSAEINLTQPKMRAALEHIAMEASEAGCDVAAFAVPPPGPTFWSTLLPEMAAATAVIFPSTLGADSVASAGIESVERSGSKSEKQHPHQPLSIPVICIEASEADKLRAALGVPADDYPGVVHARQQRDVLVEAGYSRDLADQALRKNDNDVAEALSWLEVNAEWIETQNSMMRELDRDVRTGKVEAAEGDKFGASASKRGGESDSSCDEEAESLMFGLGAGPFKAPAGKASAIKLKKQQAAADATMVSTDDIDCETDEEEIAKRERVSAYRLVEDEKEWPLARRWQSFGQEGVLSSGASKYDVLARQDRAQGNTASFVSASTASSFGTRPTATLVSMLATAQRQVAVQYARRAMAAVFTFWPPSKPMSSLATGSMLRQIVHVGLAMEPFPASAVIQSSADEDAVSSGNSGLQPSKSPSFRQSLGRVLQSEMHLGGTFAGRTVTSALHDDIVNTLLRMVDAGKADTEGDVLAAATSSPPAVVVKPFMNGLTETGAGAGPYRIMIPRARILHLSLNHTMHLDQAAGSVKSGSAGAAALAPFPTMGLFLRFYHDRDRVRPIADVYSHTLQDITVRGSEVWYDVMDPNNGACRSASWLPLDAHTSPAVCANLLHCAAGQPLVTSQGSRMWGLTAANASWPLPVYAVVDQRVTDEQVLAGTVDSALTMSELLVDTGALSATQPAADTPSAASLYVPTLLRSVFEALPYVEQSKHASACCRVAARLLRRWSTACSRHGGGESFRMTEEQRTTRRDLSRYLVKLQHAHSWLRTFSMSKWGDSGALPTHIQALMELLLAAKKAFTRLGLVELDGPAATGAAHGSTHPGDAKEEDDDEHLGAGVAELQRLDDMYLQGREGPVVCSILDVTRGNVLRSMELPFARTRSELAAMQHRMSGYGQLTTYVADVCVRTGRWYYEIMLRHPNASAGMGAGQLFTGWVTTNYSAAACRGQYIGQDPAGQSWSLSTNGFMHRGTQQQANPAAQPGLFPTPATGRQRRSARATGAAGGAGGVDSFTFRSSRRGPRRSAAKKKAKGAEMRGSFNWGNRDVVGIAVDLDEMRMTWFLNGEQQPEVFSDIRVTDGLHPAITQNGAVGGRVNLGRDPFIFGPPDGFSALEDLSRPSASWLARFEHAADVTRDVFARRPLSTRVVDMALSRELVSAESRPLPMTPVAGHSAPVTIHASELEPLMKDDPSVFQRQLVRPVHLVFQLESDDQDARLCLTQVTIRKQLGQQFPLEGMIFVSDSKPDFDVDFSWCDGFTFKHFQALQLRLREKEKERGAGATASGRDAPGAATPVAYFSSETPLQGTVTATLREPLRCRFVTIKFLVPKAPQSSGMMFGGAHSYLYLEHIRFGGLLGAHPLSGVIGTPSFADAAASLMKELRRNALESRWTAAMDGELVALVQHMSRRHRVSPLDLDAVMVMPSVDDLVSCKVIKGLPLSVLQARYGLMKYLNRLVTPLLNYVDIAEVAVPEETGSAAPLSDSVVGGAGSGDVEVVSGGGAKESKVEEGDDDPLSEVDDESLSLSRIIHDLKGLYFTSTKTSVLEALLSLSDGVTTNRAPPQQLRMTINRARAAKARDEPSSDPDGLRSIFGQLFIALRSHGYAGFARAPKDFQAWNVDFAGEGSIDVGGPYRESLTLACADLMSSATPLFLHCPNFHTNTGLNREKFVINPTATAPLSMAMFECVGALMGLALRTKFTLPLDLPSTVWKAILAEPTDERDLEDVDKLCVQALQGFRTLTAEEIVEAKQTFTTQLTGGTEVELIPGGSEQFVSPEDVGRFTELVIATRLGESARQCRAIRKGFNTVVPLGMLSLFGWREVELLVSSFCGTARSYPPH